MVLIEDPDPALHPLICPDEYGPAQQLANRLRQGFRTLMAGRGAEIEQHLTNVASGQLDLAPAPLISAWGRKVQ
jgi:hypothetical protein